MRLPHWSLLLAAAGSVIFIASFVKARAQEPTCVHYYGQPPCKAAIRLQPPPGATCWQVPNTRVPYYRCSNGYEWWVDGQGTMHTGSGADWADYEKGSEVTGPGKVKAPDQMPELNPYTGAPTQYPPMQQGLGR